MKMNYEEMREGIFQSIREGDFFSSEYKKMGVINFLRLFF